MPNNYTLYKNSFPSTDGKNKIAYFMCMPNHATPRCVVQIIHGECESFALYSELTEYLTSRGYVVCGHDHLGHGETLTEDGTEGYFAHRDGEKILVEDTLRMTSIIRENIEGLPVVFAGFGLGSLVARKIMSESNAADGYIVVDTFEKNKRTKKAKRKVRSASSFGREKRSGGRIYKKTFEINPDGRLTLRGLADMLLLVDDLSDTKKDEYVKKDIPLLLLSTEKNTKKTCYNGTKEAYSRYISARMTDVRMILYKSNSEKTVKAEIKEKVFSDVATWLNERNF